MTGPASRPERLAAALLARDTGALDALRAELARARAGPADPAALALDDVARAGLALLRPDAPREELGPDEVALLRAVSGRPGLSAAELADHTGLEERFAEVAGRLVAAGLVTGTRFERTDCWSRTARGAQALAGLRGEGQGQGRQG